LLTDDIGEKWEHSQFAGQWTEKDAGGCINNLSFAKVRPSFILVSEVWFGLDFDFDLVLVLVLVLYFGFDLNLDLVFVFVLDLGLVLQLISGFGFWIWHYFPR
jgi:hypothetical protein